MSLDERNEELNRKIDHTDLSSAVDTLIKDAKKRKRQVILLSLSIGLDLLLTVGLGFLSIQTHNVASQSENNKVALVRSCETTNDARASNKALWDYLLALPSNEPATSAQQSEIDSFKAFIDKTFAPRDCKHLIG